MLLALLPLLFGLAIIGAPNHAAAASSHHTVAVALTESGVHAAVLRIDDRHGHDPIAADLTERADVGSASSGPATSPVDQVPAAATASAHPARAPPLA